MIIETTWDSLEEQGYSSVTDYCRYLVSTGGKFEGIKINVFRGEMLCFIVNDIYAMAELEPADVGFRKVRKHRAERLSGARGCV